MSDLVTINRVEVIVGSTLEVMVSPTIVKRQASNSVADDQQNVQGCVHVALASQVLRPNWHVAFAKATQIVVGD